MDYQKMMYRRLREVGVETDFSFLRYTKLTKESCIVTDSELENHVISHADFDALSGLNKLWRELYPDSLFENLNLTVRKKPTWFKRKIAMASCYKVQKEGRYVSLCRSNFWEDQANTRVCRILSVEATEQFIQKAKASKMGLTLFVLYRLNQEVVQLLEKVAACQVWSLPVCLHQNLSEPRGNQSAFIRLEMDNQILPQELVRDYKNIMKSDVYWGAQELVPQLVKTMQKSSIAQIRKSIRKRGVTGSLTNLGSWHLEGKSSEQEAWFFSSPVASFNPINCGLMTINGRLSFSLNVLNELGWSEKQLNRILDRVLS